MPCQLPVDTFKRVAYLLTRGIREHQAQGLRKLVEKGNAKGVIEPERVIDMIAFIVSASGLEELGTPPNFGFHPLTGDRKGTYAMTVTKNWRLTFTLVDEAVIADLDLEDYH